MSLRTSLPIVAGFALAFAAASAFAQGPSVALSEASALPVASVAVVGSGAAAGVSALAQLPIGLMEAGGELVVASVQASGQATGYVLERSSDAARFGITLSRESAAGLSLVVGSSITATAGSAGLLLSAAGETIAIIPNALGHALLHDERLSD